MSLHLQGTNGSSHKRYSIYAALQLFQDTRFRYTCNSISKTMDDMYDIMKDMFLRMGRSGSVQKVGLELRMVVMSIFEKASRRNCYSFMIHFFIVHALDEIPHYRFAIYMDRNRTQYQRRVTSLWPIATHLSAFSKYKCLGINFSFNK